ncbi:c-type cytochrome [Cognatishimia activa]|uniref:Putative bifunctional cbb3-type cytochrome c oxidase subunit II/cytochrome c n=1 Tax=Cognatishimia activa TaxID=1715691 RepID=A0A0P1ITJ4_9RHOB|nr:cytochrome c [Cognatishimia activa]CUJ38147.1 putative bifunctional cbb3-type cytochrome c oxidase subunit II/cytochrome c [Cognatishimia activa]CUK26942.1 putative bifunctional cbb3-type cytochrome c oxidase subunit II/cytochrome c [Cognatishimia activa]
MKQKSLLIGLCALVGVATYINLRPAPADNASRSTPAVGTAIVAIQMPRLEGNAVIGQRIFENACAACHGSNAVGVEGAGPPLIHVIYESSHHADESFQRAVATGVRSHHWQFGNMPPVEGLTRGDTEMVIQYIREIQRANGIN